MNAEEAVEKLMDDGLIGVGKFGTDREEATTIIQQAIDDATADLRERLRRHVIRNGDTTQEFVCWECNEGDSWWYEGEPENHTDGCPCRLKENT